MSDWRRDERSEGAPLQDSSSSSALTSVPSFSSSTTSLIASFFRNEHHKLSIIIPTYNERLCLPILVYLLDETLRIGGGLTPGEHFEILIIDDSSPDGTADVCRQLQALPAFSRSLKLFSRPGKLGLGTAYCFGLRHATGDYVLLMDADWSHHPHAILRFLEAEIKCGADIVTGTRYRPTVGIVNAPKESAFSERSVMQCHFSHQSLPGLLSSGGGVYGWNSYRVLASRVANSVTVILLGITASDMTGSFRLYKTAALQKLIPHISSRGYVFQMEMLVRAIRQYHFKIIEIPICFVDRMYGISKFTSSEVAQYLLGLLKLFWTLE